MMICRFIKLLCIVKGTNLIQGLFFWFFIQDWNQNWKCADFFSFTNYVFNSYLFSSCEVTGLFLPVFLISQCTNTSEDHSPCRRILELWKDSFVKIADSCLLLLLPFLLFFPPDSVCVPGSSFSLESELPGYHALIILFIHSILCSAMCFIFCNSFL